MALLAASPAIIRPRAVLRRALPRVPSASQVGFSTAAILGVGLLLSIVTTPDPLWWQLHFSRLGTFAAFSGHVFNATIIATSVGVVLFALRLNREMVQHSGTAVLTNRRAATIVPILVALLGINLSLVGFFPVNANEFVHDRGSTGAVFCFVVILSTSRWTLRGMHRVMSRASRLVALGLVATTAPYIGGFINLAAFELIVFSLIFWWLLLFARTIGRPADAPPPKPPTRTGSMQRTVVISPSAGMEHVAIATRDGMPTHSGMRAATHPRAAVPTRRLIHGHAAQRSDLAHHRARGGRTEVDRT
ncbi:hypothetical membrane protein [Microbacterium sp. cf046]|uniref:DUF998 domain-containing protein n=1 Tax=Microbacterium sp. cf046 TaxID=1761803 RepID=UPI0008F459F5|nr:DUF998 domain-containing protein [Microbacterium sp. cf046]SFR89971.1 hypothetical membrane protein [Microbacterium sp. cf046]